MAPQSLQLVTFDLDGTLYDNGAYLPKLVRRWLLERLFRQSPLRTLRQVVVARAYQRTREASRSLGPRADLRAEVIAETARRTGFEEPFVRNVIEELIYRNPFHGSDAHVFPGVRETLAALKSRGLRLAVLSDYPVEEKLAALGLSSIGFDLLLSSEDVNALKPHPALFLEACRRLAVEPSRALHVGDRADCDVAGARAAGMKTLLLRGSRHRRTPEEPRADYEAVDFDAVRIIVETLARGG